MSNIVFVGGCAKLKQESVDHRIELTSIDAAMDSVLLDVLVIRVEDSFSEAENELWDQLDQQQIDLATRRRLADNGIRCGVANAQFPTELNDLFDEQQERRASEETDTDALLIEETVQQRLQVRSGQPSHIILSPTLPTLSWVVNDDGYLYGHENHQARCQLTVKARPISDGQVRLELLPEITYGTPQQRIGVGNNALIYEIKQDRHSLEPLKLVSELQAGQWLVMGNTETAVGIGEEFLRDAQEKGSQRKLVLIGVSSSQPNSVFQLDESSAPIATPTD